MIDRDEALDFLYKGWRDSWNAGRDARQQRGMQRRQNLFSPVMAQQQRVQNVLASTPPSLQQQPPQQQPQQQPQEVSQAPFGDDITTPDNESTTGINEAVSSPPSLPEAFANLGVPKHEPTGGANVGRHDYVNEGFPKQPTDITQNIPPPADVQAKTPEKDLGDRLPTGERETEIQNYLKEREKGLSTYDDALEAGTITPEQHREMTQSYLMHISNEKQKPMSVGEASKKLGVPTEENNTTEADNKDEEHQRAFDPAYNQMTGINEEKEATQTKTPKELVSQHVEDHKNKILSRIEERAAKRANDESLTENQRNVAELRRKIIAATKEGKSKKEIDAMVQGSNLIGGDININGEKIQLDEGGNYTSPDGSIEITGKKKKTKTPKPDPKVNETAKKTIKPAKNELKPPKKATKEGKEALNQRSQELNREGFNEKSRPTTDEEREKAKANKEPIEEVMARVLANQKKLKEKAKKDKPKKVEPKKDDSKKKSKRRTDDEAKRAMQGIADKEPPKKSSKKNTQDLNNLEKPDQFKLERSTDKLLVDSLLKAIPVKDLMRFMPINDDIRVILDDMGFITQAQAVDPSHFNQLTFGENENIYDTDVLPNLLFPVDKLKIKQGAGKQLLPSPSKKTMIPLMANKIPSEKGMENLGYFIRDGDTRRRMTEKEANEIWANRPKTRSSPVKDKFDYGSPYYDFSSRSWVLPLLERDSPKKPATLFAGGGDVNERRIERIPFDELENVLNQKSKSDKMISGGSTGYWKSKNEPDNPKKQQINQHRYSIGANFWNEGIESPKYKHLTSISPSDFKNRVENAGEKTGGEVRVGDSLYNAYHLKHLLSNLNVNQAAPFDYELYGGENVPLKIRGRGVERNEKEPTHFEFLTAPKVLEEERWSSMNDLFE